MKKFVTFLLTMVFAVVGVVSSYAQEKPVPKTSALATDGNTIQYLYNKEAGAFFTQGNAWGTQASYLPATGNPFKISVSNGVTEITDKVANGNWMNPFIDGQGGIYVDNGSDPNSHAWVITHLEDGSFEITNTVAATDKKVGIDPAETANIIIMTDSRNAYTAWVAVSEADYAAYQEAYQAWVLTQYGPGDDVSFLASTWKTDMKGSVGSYGGLGGVAAAEIYNSGGSWPTGNVLYQSIEGIKDGTYQVTLEGAASYTSGRGFVCPTGEGLSELFANDEVQSMAVQDRGWVSGGQQDVAVLEVGVWKGNLKFGIRNLADAGNWYVARLSSIKYLSEELPAPVVGQISIEPTGMVSPDDLETVKITIPVSKLLKGAANYEIEYKGTISVGGKELPFSGKSESNATIEVEIPAEYVEVGKTYTVSIAEGDIKVIDKSGEQPVQVATNTESFEGTFRTATLTELAQAEYDQTLEEAYALLEYATEHVGVGVMLYLPAKVAEYQDALETASNLSYRYKIYNDYKEGTELLNYLMCELQPQYPKLNQRYLVKHKVSGLYLNADSGVKLSPNATPVAFHHVDGAKEEARFFMYSTPDREYICYEGSDTKTLTNQTMSIEGGKFMIKHNHTTQAYNFVGMNGALGTEAKAVDSAIFGDKAEDAANSQWLLELYDEPEVVMTKPEVATTTLATDGETIQYFYNKETNSFFSQGNAWGTQASYFEKKANQFKVSIADGVTEIYDLATAGGAQKWMNPFIDGQGGLYVDNGSASNSHAWTITVLEDGGFEIANTELATDKKVGIDPAEAKNIIQMTNAAGAYTTWYAVSEDDFNQYLADLEAYEQWVRENTELQPGTDLTYLATEGFTSAVGNVGTVADWAWSGHEGANEVYNGAGAVPAGDVLVQTISNLQNGVYEVTLEVAASFTSGRGFEANVGEGLAEAFANSAVQGIEVYDRSSLTADGADQVTLTAIVADGTLKFGVRNVADGGNWYLAYLKQIVFVSKDVKSILNKQPEATEITSVSSDATPAAIFSANGARISKMQKGINIVKMSDGSVKKVMVK